MINKLTKILNSQQFQRFFIIGISSFIVDFTLLQIFIRVFNIAPNEHSKETIANIGSAIISIIFNFILQRSWAFESKKNSMSKEAGKFILVHAFNLFVYQTVLFTAVNLILPNWISKIAITSIQIVSSYILYKFFVFRTKTDKDVLSATVESGLN